MRRFTTYWKDKWTYLGTSVFLMFKEIGERWWLWRKCPAINEIILTASGVTTWRYQDDCYFLQFFSCLCVNLDGHDLTFILIIFEFHPILLVSKGEQCSKRKLHFLISYSLFLWLKFNWNSGQNIEEWSLRLHRSPSHWKVCLKMKLLFFFLGQN